MPYVSSNRETCSQVLMHRLLHEATESKPTCLGNKDIKCVKQEGQEVDLKMLYIILNSTGGHEYLFSVQLLAHENVITDQVHNHSRPHYLDLQNLSS